MTVAAAYSGDASIAIVERERGMLTSGEVEIEMAYTGVCGTDLHVLHGNMDARVTMPQVLGHEMSGVIVKVGPNTPRWQVGERVTVMPWTADGICPACLDGHKHLCHALNFIGIDSPGAMQEHLTVPTDVLLRLPASLPLDAAALVEPTAVAVHDVRRAQLQEGERVLVVGGGPIGVLIATVARIHGADPTVVEPNPFRRSLAVQLGFRVIDPGDPDHSNDLHNWTRGAGVDVAFEVSGTQGGLTTALEALGVRGRLCLVGIHPDPTPVDLHRVFWRELSLIGARLYVRSDFERAIELVAAGDVPVVELISRVVPLEAAASAFEAIERGGDVMKVLVDCRPERNRE